MFAHHPWELRIVPNLAGTKFCPKLKEGTCETSEDCPFAHSREELRSTDDVFKTSQCKFYDNGGCSLSDNCRFAHGAEELRPKLKSVQPPIVQLPHENEYHFWSSANSGRRLSAIAAQIQKASRKNSTLDVMEEAQTTSEGTPVSTL